MNDQNTGWMNMGRVAVGRRFFAQESRSRCQRLEFGLSTGTQLLCFRSGRRKVCAGTQRTYRGDGRVEFVGTYRVLEVSRR